MRPPGPPPDPGRPPQPGTVLPMVDLALRPVADDHLLLEIARRMVDWQTAG
ncbi:protein of unknown function [Candidatus Hydrogenisulfobacillus filiaventi]|uniref:Uncharacterized protein n=1 Tax=Candidatus Hydrogenisulfobacillus filiaventi TaxID=2707344 RepID=A0A6F8ZDF2_9FIRM|nr:hypothetical protein [Bacillota bacterium]CAB1127690.1 protein of unknown function [Candidatus Hydrogenisulfobacillus filiaventi]